MPAGVHQAGGLQALVEGPGCEVGERAVQPAADVETRPFDGVAERGNRHGNLVAPVAEVEPQRRRHGLGERRLPPKQRAHRLQFAEAERGLGEPALAQPRRAHRFHRGAQTRQVGAESGAGQRAGGGGLGQLRELAHVRHPEQLGLDPLRFARHAQQRPQLRARRERAREGGGVDAGHAEPRRRRTAA